MRFFVALIGMCGALWWADAYFFRGKYLQELEHEGLALNSQFIREVDRIVQSVSPR